VLSGDSTLTNGTETFSASLASLGVQTIAATDTVTATITGRSNTIEVATNSNLHGFQATGDMGTERAAHTATLLASGKVLISGGFNSTHNLATAELFDPATGTFTPTGDMTASRFSHTATLLAHGPAATNGKVLIAGGSNDSGDLATAELFDPATGTFTATGATSELRSEHTATLLNNGKVLLAGGTVDNVTERFDPATGSFTSTGGMLTGGRWGCTATLLNDGTVLITGGRDGEFGFDFFSIFSGELFNPRTGAFATAGQMTDARFGHTAALLTNGKVLLTGGNNGDALRDTELFDPTTGAFSATGLMGSPRVHHTATLLNDGTVLVAGGFSLSAPGGGGGFATADVFDPTTNTFPPASPMGIARFLHTATRLSNGQALITGGRSKMNPGLYVKSAELYK
jgi:WD40 repeat protein